MDRWLHAQRLGVTASVLVTHPGTHPAFRAARKILQTDMTTGRAQAEASIFFAPSLLGFSPLLARAFKQRLVPRLNTFAVLAEKALQHNLIGREDDTSTIARAQIWAYHVLLSHTRTDGLLRLGRTLFGHYEQWLTIDSSPICREEIARHLATIRDPLVSTPEKCHAIGKLGRILGQTPFWEQIENILYHNQFCWPLVVFDSASSQSGPQALALSLPVAVDIRFDNHGEIRQTTGAGVLAPKWEKQLEKAVHAAKTLWRSEHENCGRFRDMVDAASVTLDVSFAERIVETLPKLSMPRFPFRTEARRHTLPR